VTDWLEIGNCRIACGDCLEILPDLEVGSVDAVVTDPPYGIEWQSNWRKDTFDVIAGDSQPNCDWIDEVGHLRFGIIYLFTRWDVMQFWIDAIHCHTELRVRDVLVWDKVAHGAGDLKSYAPTYELVIYATLDRETLVGKRHQNLFRYWRVDAGATGKSSRKLLCHPCQKPVELMVAIVNNHKGQTILDPLMGSGTTGVACIQTGRRFVGIEISPQYFKIAAKRIQMAWENRQRRLF